MKVLKEAFAEGAQKQSAARSNPAALRAYICTSEMDYSFKTTALRIIGR
jgi:hypothetical protein